MSDDKDEFALMDELQDDVDAAVSEMLPFEPDREVREDTAIEEEVEALPPSKQASLDDDDVVDPLADLELPALEDDDV